MTTPADLDDRLARLDARMGAVEAELARWRAAAPYPAPYPPHQQYPPPYPQQQPPPYPPQQRPYPGGPPVPRPPRDWSRLPVWAGGAVTFIGVLFLLVIAAAAFGPVARVVTGALLGAVLAGLGGWLARRSGPGAGPSALAGTGAAALFGSVVAATSLYELLPVPVGLLLCLLVAGGGIALADRWDSTPFAVAVLVGVEIAVIAVAGELDALTLGMAVLVQAGVAPTALRRVPALAPVAAGWTGLHGLIVAFGPEENRTAGVLLVVAGLALVVGVAVAVLGALRGQQIPAAIGIATAPVALLGMLTIAATWPGVAVTLAGAALVAAVAVPRRLDRVVRIVAVSVAALLVAFATAKLLDGTTLAGVLLAEALVLFGPAARLRARPLQLAGAWLAVVGGFAALGTALDVDSVLDPRPASEVGVPVGGLVVAGLLVLVAGAGLVAALRTGLPDIRNWAAWAWLPVAAGLYGVSWLVVTAAQLVVPGSGGFLTGHVLVTLGVIGLGVLLLVRGLHRPVVARTGFALIVAALVKLVLFDLVTLNGLARVAAFIGAGLVLLAVGTWYANRAGVPATAPAPGSADPAGDGR